MIQERRRRRRPSAARRENGVGASTRRRGFLYRLKLNGGAADSWKSQRARNFKLALCVFKIVVIGGQYDLGEMRQEARRVGNGGASSGDNNVSSIATRVS